MRALSFCALFLLPSCISLNFGDEGDPPPVRVRGLVSGHAQLSGFEDYQGPLLGLDLGHDIDRGELVALDVGPIFGVGIGVAGARLRVWPLDIGLGLLFYDASPPEESAPEGAPADRSDRPEDDHIDR
jgi:hypothetical protein